jgi:hypothetical protein
LTAADLTLAGAVADTNVLGVMSSPTKLARSPAASRGLGLAAANVSVVQYLKSPERFPHGMCCCWALWAWARSGSLTGARTVAEAELTQLNPAAALAARLRLERDKENANVPRRVLADPAQGLGKTLFSPKVDLPPPRPTATDNAAVIPRFYFPAGANPAAMAAERERRRLVLVRSSPSCVSFLSLSLSPSLFLLGLRWWWALRASGRLTCAMHAAAAHQAAVPHRGPAHDRL